MTAHNFPTRFLALFLLTLATFHSGWAQERPDPNERLAAILKRFPQSDLNKDEVLSQEEAAKFFRQRREANEKQRSARVEPDFKDVAYGEHPKQAFDLWLVPGASEPTPLVIFIHGGGFRSGDKSRVSASILNKCLESGVAFASMNYRLSDVGPYPIMMEDCARGLQTIRHRAAEWNLDAERIACYGGSAGAGISLWLGFHEDLADPESDDPIARESTRILAAGTMNGQSTYDLNDFREWFSVPNLKADSAMYPLYAIENEEDWDSERVKALMKDASSINHLTKDDVPVYMTYSRPNTVVTAETPQGVWVHHVQLGLKLQEAMQAIGLECLVSGPDVKPEHDPYGSLENFLINKVKN